MNLKKDFPIFENNKGLIYLDSTASAQKPSFVIDGTKSYFENDYSNIHRGAYSLSHRSETFYESSKKKVSNFIGAKSWREVIYTLNSTYASNLLVLSLKRSGFFKKGDKVLLSIVEHHANVVPWLILKEEIGIEIEYVKIKDDFSLDFQYLENKLDSSVKAVSITHVSNVTGEIFDLERVGNLLKEKYSEENKPIFIIDASQSIPHFEVNVEKLRCDFMFFTGHKIMADSGIGVLWGKENILKDLKPGISGGGAISWVKKECFLEAGLPDRFEPGTQNLSGAVSLLKALEYIENIGGYQKIEELEKDLILYFIEKLDFLNNILKNRIKLIGGKNTETRVGVFTFVVDNIHSLDIADYLAENNICIRAGLHCAEPFLGEISLKHTCRASLYIYNDKSDIDIFFDILKKAIEELSY